MKLLLISLLTLFICCKSSAQTESAEDFQQKLNEQYAGEETSPLTANDRAEFKGLPFFPVNHKYVVTATLEKPEKATPFKMKTTTERKPEYVVYAVATFEIEGTTYRLNIYKSYGKSMPGYEDYLFLPFTDATNGDETYGGGRFIDLREPEGNTITIDFNKAYNPYCAYNHKYSCPVPPKENDLNIKIEAGVKYTPKD